MTAYILLIETNNLDQQDSLISTLETRQYQVFVAHDLQTAIHKVETLWPDLIICNSVQALAKADHLQQTLESVGLDIPCLVVSNEDIELAAPFTNIAPGELIHHIEESLIQRQERFIRLTDLTLDCRQQQVLRGDKRFSLTPKEFRLLHLLITHRDEVLTRKKIMQEVWETDYLGDTRTLDVHIRWVREKIEQNPSRPAHLLTVRGVGYRFITKPTE